MFKRVSKKGISEKKKRFFVSFITVAFVVLFNSFIDINLKSILVIIPVFTIAMVFAISIDLKKMRLQHDADESDCGAREKAKLKYLMKMTIALVFFIACMTFVATRPVQLYDEMKDDIKDIDDMHIWSPLEDVDLIEVPDAKVSDFQRISYHIKMKPVGISRNVIPIPDGEEIYHFFLHNNENSKNEDVTFTTDGYVYIDNCKYELKAEDTETLIDFIEKASTLEL